MRTLAGLAIIDSPAAELRALDSHSHHDLVSRAAFWRSRRGRWTATLLVLALASCAALSWVTRRRVYRTVASTEASLDAAGLVHGASSARVRRVLDSLHATYSVRPTERTIAAVLGPSFEDVVTSGDIYAEFAFDSTGHLASRLVKERLTGP